LTPVVILFRAIFGALAADVLDTSLRVPPGVAGTVVEIRVFSWRGIAPDERAISIGHSPIELISYDRDDGFSILKKSFGDHFSGLLTGEKYLSGLTNIDSNSKLTFVPLDNLNVNDLTKINIEEGKTTSQIEALIKNYENQLGNIIQNFENKIDKIQSGGELLPGVLKLIKVFIAVKRKLPPGDKMAGRPGPKGVLSPLCPVAAKKFLEDGRPVGIPYTG
jgi:DNA-directed RNA polymerase, beta subunit/140 kD subunit